MKRFLSNAIVLTVLLSAIFVSCEPESIDGIILDKTSAILTPKNVLVLNATTYPTDIADNRITWTSDNPSVATVKNGVVSAISDGVATITASAKRGYYTQSCNVLVTSKTIYMPGMVDGKAVLWKNGRIEELEEAELSRPVSIFVSDNDDVYICGHDLSQRAKLWKNGVLQDLDDPINGCVFSSFATGSDVYAAGYAINPNSRINVRLWKNGIIQDLEYMESHFGGEANSVFVAGNDVYVAGSMSARPMLWKNGIMQDWASEIGHYYSVFVSGNDTYVAGVINTDSCSIAVLWKNGIAQHLTDGKSYAYASSVFVSENDVYVCGAINQTITLWKNGVKQNLEDTHPYHSSHVFVSGSNVFVNSSGPLWVNGKRFYFKGDYRGIFVK